MANIKQLKKDVDYLTFAVIGDCLNHCYVSGKENDEVTNVIKDTVALRNELRDRINAARKIKDKKELKSTYNAIFKDLLVNVDGAFNKLSEVVKAS